MKTQQKVWCGEGDLNPHEIAPASTSTYTKYLVRRVYSGLGRYFGSHRVPSGILVGTNTSQNLEWVAAVVGGEA
jgi:hypothetical protein